MYSKAKIAGHPIHPMLVAFPIAFYTSTVATLIAFAVTRDTFWFRAAMFTNIAGVIMAVAALIPGAIDLFSLPVRSRARTTGYQHAAANLIATSAFLVSAILLWRSWHSGEGTLGVAAPIALGAVGLVAMGVAGALGWTLVQRHHVGIKPSQLPSGDRPIEEVDDLDELPPPTIRPARASRPTPITWH